MSLLWHHLNHGSQSFSLISIETLYTWLFVGNRLSKIIEEIYITHENNVEILKFSLTFLFFKVQTHFPCLEYSLCPQAPLQCCPCFPSHSLHLQISTCSPQLLVKTFTQTQSLFPATPHKGSLWSQWGGSCDQGTGIGFPARGPN